MKTTSVNEGKEPAKVNPLDRPWEGGEIASQKNQHSFFAQTEKSVVSISQQASKWECRRSERGDRYSMPKI